MDVIVSLTTISSRLSAFEATLKSVLAQDLRPSRIVVNVSEEPYLSDQGIARGKIEGVVGNMRHAEHVEVSYVENTGPYRKLLPVLSRLSEENVAIVTCDDDTVYPPGWLAGLHRSSIDHPNAIIAYRCSKVLIRNGRVAPYLEWARGGDNLEVAEHFRSLFVFPTGKDGVLYKPRFLHRSVYDPELRRLAPTGDDLLFKVASLMSRTPVIPIPHHLAGGGEVPQFAEIGELRDKLWDTNINRNDAMFADVLFYYREHYGLRIEHFFRH